MKARLMVILTVLQLLLCSICFADEIPQFEHLFSYHGYDYYYDSSHTYWQVNKNELDTIVRINDNQGTVWTEMYTLKNGGSYCCLVFSIKDSDGNRTLDDRTTTPQYEEVVNRTQYRLFNKIWNIMLPQR